MPIISHRGDLMDIKQAAQAIRDSVPMAEILQLYGYKTKHGFMVCPFHGDHDASLKVYPDTGGWHCFGCERGGSVIDFVMEHENCNFRTAVAAIDRALHMGLIDPHEDALKADDEKRIQDWLDDFVKAVDGYLNTLIDTIERGQQTRLAMVRVLEDKRDRDKQQLTADEWTLITAWKDEDEYDEDRKARIESFREEVKAWRRIKRRAPSASSVRNRARQGSR